MAKLSQSDIRALSERWAAHIKKIALLEKDRNAEMHPHQVAFEKKTQPIVEKYDTQIDKLQEKADAIELQVTEWLESQTKSITLTSKSAIASFFKGKKESKDRVVNAQKFLAFVKEKGAAAVYKCVKVVIKDAEKLIGKTELDKICTKPKEDVEEATLVLKD